MCNTIVSIAFPKHFLHEQKIVMHDVTMSSFSCHQMSKRVASDEKVEQLQTALATLQAAGEQKDRKSQEMRQRLEKELDAYKQQEKVRDVLDKAENTHIINIFGRGKKVRLRLKRKKFEVGANGPG